MKIPGSEHPITIISNPSRIRVVFAGRVVAEAARALTLTAAKLPVVQYLPRADSDMTAFERTAHTTHCAYKGDATYYSLRVGGSHRDQRCLDLRDPLSRRSRHPRTSGILSGSCRLHRRARGH